MTTAQGVRTLSPGAAITYHTGYALRGVVPEVLSVVRMMYDSGELELCQRRASDGRFEYRAQRRRRQAKVPHEQTFRFYMLAKP